MKKKFLILVIVAVLALSGCSDKKNKETENKKETEPVETATENKYDNEEVFTATYPVDFTGIAPLEDEGAGTKMVLRNMQEGLFRYEPSGSLADGVLEKCEVTSDGTYLIFDLKLKENVKFHNGKNLTTEDVKYSLMRVAGLVPEIPKGTLLGVDYWDTLLNGDPEKGQAKGKIEIIDDYNMKLYLDDALGVLSTKYAMADAVLVSSDYPESSQRENPVSIGKYKFVEYVPGDHITFQRFEDYYGEKPEIKNAEFKKYADGSTVPIAFEAGDIDIMDLTNENRNLYESKGLYIDSRPSNNVRILYFNMRDGKIFADKNLRLAVQHAIDKEKMNQTLTSGKGTILNTHMTPVHEKYYNETLENYYPYDVEKAKEYLKQTSYPDGFDITIKTVAENDLEQDMASLIIEDLKAIGINAVNEPVPWNTYYEEIYRGHNYDLTILNIVGYADPYLMISRYKTDVSGNMPGLSNGEFDLLLDEAKMNLEEDSNSIDAYRRMQEILTEESVGVFTIDPGTNMVLSEKYTGFEYYPFAFIDIGTIKYK